MKFGNVQHVSVPRPAGSEAHESAIGFYSGILGFESIPKPPTLDSIEVTWFRQGDQEIHVYARSDGEPSPDSEAHFCVTVDDVDGARRHLVQSGYACEDTVPIPHRPRFFIRDPFGNRIEITQIEGDYNAP